MAFLESARPKSKGFQDRVAAVSRERTARQLSTLQAALNVGVNRAEQNKPIEPVSLFQLPTKGSIDRLVATEIYTRDR